MLKVSRRISGPISHGLVVAGLLIGSVSAGPAASRAGAQEKQPEAQASKKEEPKAQEKSKMQEKPAPVVITFSPAEKIVEFAILGYGGRPQLDKVRSGIHEIGTIRLATDQGDINGNYSFRSLKRDKSWEDLIRVDLDLSPPAEASRQGVNSIKYTIAYNGASIWSAQNNQYVNSKPEVEAAFRAQLTHEYTALLRYREDGSKLELIGPETVVGVEANVIELTTSQGEKTRFWVSTKSYRILHAEYELKLVEGQPPTKYRVSYFYTPLKIVQNTLVPTRRVMSQDGKFVQEIIVTDFQYSAKLDPEVFQHLQ
ncbi:MAG TPA: hypothetical protein VE262_00130 [Blastocatellia bacterium]|nr:hypothetical protein [Blastocatellia bacterium]